MEANQNPVIPKYYYSPNHSWFECPTCKTKPSSLTQYQKKSYPPYDCETVYLESCSNCGQLLNWDWKVIEESYQKQKERIAKKKYQTK